MRPSPADTQTALNVARNLFPERPNTMPTRPETHAATATPTNTAPPAQSNQPADPTQPQPSTPRRPPGAPVRDDYPYRYGPEYRLTIHAANVGAGLQPGQRAERA
jgi:hypothetical protein